MARYFKEQDIDEFRECFYLFARSGQITSLDELTVVMRSLGMSPTIQELTGYLKGKGGKMSFADFLEVMHIHSRAENLPHEVSLQLDMDTIYNMDEHPQHRVKLNGAARKRFRRLLAANVQVDEARALAIKPWKEIPITNIPPDPKAKKRPRSEEESPGIQITKAPRVEEKAPNFSKVVKQTRVGIRNLVPMSEDQMRLVHRSLTLAMLKIVDKGKGPKFTGFTHRPGFIVITCEDQASLKWLYEKVHTIKPWSGAMLSIIPESELPKPVVGTVFIPSSEAESLDEATKLLGIQNAGLNTELWRVAHSRAEGNGHVVSFFLDDTSVAALRAKNFEVALGFKKLTFRVKNDPMVGASTSNVAGWTQEPQPSTSKGFERQGRVNPYPRIVVDGRTPESRPWSPGQLVEPYPSTSKGSTNPHGQGREPAGSRDAIVRGPRRPMSGNRGSLASPEIWDGNYAWRSSRGPPRP